MHLIGSPLARIRQNPEPAEPRTLAIIRQYDDLVAAARARMDQLQITFETLDAVAGVPSGYSAKLLGPNPRKRLGLSSCWAIMGALGLQLLAVEDADALARVRDRLVRRRRRRALHQVIP